MTSGEGAGGADSSGVSTVDSGSESTGEAVVAKEETPAQVIANIKKYKGKVDGEDFEEDVDLNDDAGMTRRLQMARAAEKRIASANTEKKKANAIIRAFEEDPQNFLKNLGPKGREIAEQYLLGEIQNDMLTPEEKEMRQLKSENETYKQKEAREKEERDQAVNQKKEFEYAQTFQTTIITALEKSGLPKTPSNVKRMASIMSKNLEHGLELTPDDLAADVLNDRKEELRAIIKDMDGDQLIQFFGQEEANKIRRSDLKKLQEKNGQVFQSGPKTQAVNSTPRHKGPQTMDEFFADADRRARD